MTKINGLKRPFTIALALTAAAALASCSTTTSPTSSLTSSTSTSTTPSVSLTTSSASASATPPSPTSPTSAAAPLSSGRRIDITVSGKQVTPKPGLVNIAVGESLTISVTSDHNDQLHAHGFEIEKVIKAGQPLVFTVKGAEPGVYDVELHHPELRILQVAVR